MADREKATGKGSANCTSAVITLLLLLAVIVTGTSAYNAREQWWDRYLSFIRR
jgi:hypothetical protein